jgi:hypothetical protein
MTTAPTPAPEKDGIFVQIGYYGVFYLAMLVVEIIGYPFSQQYIRPIMSFIFPINLGNSLLKSLLVMTGMYWSMVTFLIVMKRRQQSR